MKIVDYYDNYSERLQDIAQDMERNLAAPRQTQVTQSNQLLLTLPPFPVRYPADVHCSPSAFRARGVEEGRKGREGAF